MSPSSVPVVPVQPDSSNYGVDALALFRTFTRQTYLSTYGVQAPAWDPSRPPKFWFDSTVDVSAPSDLVLYKFVDLASGTVRQLALPAAEAASVNLPGTIVYPAYVVAPTGATRSGSAMNAQWLSRQPDALALMAQLGGTNLVDAGQAAQAPVLYPPDEDRRMWTFTVSGLPVNVGMLLVTRNAGGVGSPGRWESSVVGPQWVAAPPGLTGLDDARPPRPVPVRDLLSNERLVPSAFGLGGVTVVRTDVGTEQAGGFAVGDRSLLQEIYRLVTKLGI